MRDVALQTVFPFGSGFTLICGHPNMYKYPWSHESPPSSKARGAGNFSFEFSASPA